MSYILGSSIKEREKKKSFSSVPMFVKRRGKKKHMKYKENMP
jgi:hypothetical protein